MRFPPRALAHFARLPVKERWFVRARWFSAPLEALVEKAPSGEVIEVGCGHGLLTAMLADSPHRRVTGIDPDGRKLRWAREALEGVPNIELQERTIEQLAPEWHKRADAVVICDVLYLLPLEKWSTIFKQVHGLLRPGGRLIWKEAEDDGGWKARKCLLQEKLMVKVIGKTHGSGGLHLQPRSVALELLEGAGFSGIEVTDLSRGFSTPHTLFTAGCRT